ncbi:MAG: PKD domain-containing protein [Ferruginibacter sp.]
MKIKFSIVTIIALLCGVHFGVAQNLSNKGKDFWVGYGHHQFMEQGQTNGQEMVLYLSAEQAANVTVTIDGTTWIRNYAIPANTVKVSDLIPKAGTIDARLISLPCSFVPPGSPCGGEGVFSNKGIHIVSDVPIVAYAHIYGSASSGATMLMPVETWGYSYVTLNSKQDYAANCFSWAYAIAQQDNTVIEVTPTANTRTGKPANMPFTVTLNRGQIFQLMAGPETGATKPELSGTKIKSIANPAGQCYPIAVFSGSSRTHNEPVSCGTAIGGDNDNQQCFPSQAWGKRYLTAPTSNSTTPSTPMYNTFKIAVNDVATQVRRNGVLLTGIIANSYYEFISNQPEYITADKPIMVSQYIHSGSACQGGTGVGDPEMMYISPIEQGIKKIGFFRNNLENITVNYLTLIIPTAGLSSLLIDGSSTFSHTYPHPGLPGYTIVIKKWSGFAAPPAPPPGQCIAQSDSAFTAITYGLGNVESYGYNAGTNINNLNAVGSIFNASDTTQGVTSHPFTCTNSPVELSVLLGYPTPPSKLVWQLSQLATVLTPNADVIDNAPTPVGPAIVINGITYYKFTIPGTYSFNAMGTYTVPILATHPSIDNCTNTERVSYDVIVKAKPLAGFTFTHSGCIADPVQFTGPASTGNGYTLNQWLWTFPGPTTDNTQSPSHTFTATGNQNVTLHVVSTEGCVSDSIKAVPIFPKPAVTISTTPASASICPGGTVTFTGNVSFGGSGSISSYYWDFGNTTTNNTAGPHTITYNTPGTYNAYHIAGVSNACKSDTAFKTITVFAKPTTTFSYPAGCLPAGGAVQFTSLASAPDGQAITTHAWTFGDPGSGAANTSNLANPVHNYSTFGNYTITYTVTTANGCTKDTTVNATFNMAPTFNYPALPAVCYDAAPVSVATATVTNGVTGSGVYHGPGTTLAGLFTPSVAGAGTHTIWYVFSTAAGCNDSVSRTITVYPRVGANFVIPTATCLPTSGNVQLNYSGTISAGQQYLWNFGDPGSGANNTSTLQNPTHNYTTGNYTISLTVTATNGCVDDSVMTTTFTVKPALTYPALTAVCESVAGTISVATASVTNGVPGSGVYHGPATDLAGNFNPSLAGPGTHTIWYVFTATGNCVDSVSRTIVVNAKPAASFNFTSAACLPTTGLVQFTYNGSLSAGQQYLWNFGDPPSGAANTSTLQNPTHNYSNTGVHTLSVTVTNTNGCVDDSVVTAIFSVKPALSYPALTSVCQSEPNVVSIATATVTNGVTGTGVYHGPGTNAAGDFDPAIAGAGPHTIWYVFTSTANCIDSVSQVITVKPKPLSSFIPPAAACLPTTGLAQFTYNGSAAAGQTYLWDFGDPASGAANSSTLQSPSHNYSNTGSHSVVLTVTGTNGCTDDTVVVRTFSVTPALSYPALTAVCESVGGTVSVATATVTNGVSGTGVYSGTGTSAAGDFNPATAGPGTHIITYTFTSAGNCVATITKTITVYQKPASAFTATSDICLGQQVSIANITPAAPAGIQSWKWYFGDATTATNNNNNAFTKLYTSFGTYTVKLVTVSSNGCNSDTAYKTVAVHAVPKPDFTMPASVCMPGTTNFTNTSVAPDGAALTYTWNFGDASAPSAQTSPGHAYATANTYSITLLATSGFGCFEDTVKTFSAFFDKPIADFDVTPSTLCQGTPNNFTNHSTAPNSTVASYLWTFGDNTTADVKDPVKVYTAPGVYTIQLQVTSTEQCVSDPFPKTVTVYLQPVIDAGPSFIVAQGTTIQFKPTANDSTHLAFQWSPPTGLSDPSALRPMLQANNDQLYTLKATGDGNCTATDTVSVKVYKPVKIPNAFSPNGDLTNDTWVINNITDYAGATVEIYNRYGQKIFFSTGYATPWDGTYNGKPLPVATYYYIIDLKHGFKTLSGSVTLIR